MTPCGAVRVPPSLPFCHCSQSTNGHGVRVGHSGHRGAQCRPCPDGHPTPTPCPTGLCRHPRDGGRGTEDPRGGDWAPHLRSRVGSAGAGAEHTGSCVGCRAVAAPRARRSSRDALRCPWFKVQPWVWSSAVSQPSSTPRFLVRPSSCPAPALSSLSFLVPPAEASLGPPSPGAAQSLLIRCPALGHGGASGFQLCP